VRRCEERSKLPDASLCDKPAPLTRRFAHRRGLHCYCEKPVSRDYEEGKKAIDSFDNSKLWCAYYRRYLPKFVAIRAALPKLGSITGVKVTLRQKRHLMPEDKKNHWHFEKEVSGGGLIMDLGSHILDLLDNLLGPLLNVNGSCSRVHSGSPGGDDIEDTVVGFWKHEGGDQGPILGSCEFNFAAGENLDEIRIQGTQGTLSFAAFSDVPAVYSSVSEDVEPEMVGFDHLGGVQEHVHGLLFASIVDDLIAGTSLCANTESSALRTMVVLDKLLGGRENWRDNKIESKEEK